MLPLTPGPLKVPPGGFPAYKVASDSSIIWTTASLGLGNSAMEIDLDEDLKKLDVGSLAPPEVQPKVQPKEPPLSEEVKESDEGDMEWLDELMESKSRSIKKPDTDNILDM